jgi:hypothetical protein
MQVTDLSYHVCPMDELFQNVTAKALFLFGHAICPLDGWSAASELCGVDEARMYFTPERVHGSAAAVHHT